MIPRLAPPRLIELAGYDPIVAMTGPRQSGKARLARATLPEECAIIGNPERLRENLSGCWSRRIDDANLRRPRASGRAGKA